MILNPACNLITVVGGKGGVGKSIFAANLSIATLMELKTPVLLLDADAKSAGDQNIILGIQPQKTISEITSYTGAINPQTFPQLLSAHSSGVSYIGAIRNLEEKLDVNPDMFLRQLESFSRSFKYIIADIGTEFGPLQKALLEESTAIIAVTAPEVLVVTQTKRLLGELVGMTFPVDMIQLVVNRVSPSGISPQAIAQQLQVGVIGSIPQDDVTVTNSLMRSQPFMMSSARSPLGAAYIEVVRRLTGGVLQKLKASNRPKLNLNAVGGASGGGTVAAMSDGDIDHRNLLKIRIHDLLIDKMGSELTKGLTETQGDPQKEAALRTKTQQAISQIVDKEAANQSREERSRLISEVLKEALGLGPLEDLLANPGVSEIMVNGYKKIFLEQSGNIELSPITFTSNTHLRNVIERIVTPLGRRIDEKTPYVDARLKDGSRVNAIIPPLALDGPAVTIRKFKKGGIAPEQYIKYGSLTSPMIEFLKICVENGLNVVISGGTGSGKTSLLNMLSSFIPSHDRIITVEDAAELQLQQEHVVRLETRPPNMEGTGAVTIRDLIRNALRMRPDRIVVGECRDGAALDMLQAMNTGHDGSMTTTHANNPRECIARLETLSLMAGMDLPVRAIREQIASAVHLIVQASRLSDGSRKVTSITEVSGMQGEVVTLSEIFRYKETGYDKASKKVIGQFQAMGHIPVCVQKLDAKGVEIPRSIFSPDSNPGSATVASQAAGATGSPKAEGAKVAGATPSSPNNMVQMPNLGAFKKAMGGGGNQGGKT